MKHEEGKMPAWLVCDGIVSKMRDEFLSQAVAVMHEQLDKGRISLSGVLPELKEGSGEKERDAFLLSRIVKEREKIERQFASFMRNAQVGKEAAARAEELQRFLLELRQIALLHDYSRACESWLVEVEKELGEASPEAILIKTIKNDEEPRSAALDYALKNKELEREGIFSQAERNIMQNALRIASA